MDLPDKDTGNRSGLWVFLLLVLVFAGAILATALLANDQKNLTALKLYFGLEVRQVMRADAPRPAPRTTFKGKRLKGMSVILPGDLVANTLTGDSGTFHRRVYMKAEELCRRLQDKGVANGGWKPSPVNPEIRECWAEGSVPDPQEPDKVSSFFFMMKSDAAGTVRTARMKIVIASPANDPVMRRHMADATDVFVQATGWTEFREMTTKILALEPFRLENFGASMAFTKEFSGEGRYNLIFSLSSKDPPAKRTAAFFDQTNFLPLPRDLLTSPETFLKTPAG